HLIFPGQGLRIPGMAPDTEQLAAIDANLTPFPPTQLQYQGRDNESRPEPVVAEPVTVATAAAAPERQSRVTPPPVTLLLEEDILPPAAVLPDNQELATGVTAAEQEAEALDPQIDVAQTTRQVTDELLADPSNYSVAANNSIEIQASETLGHYADWLGLRAWDIRRLNGMVYSDPIIIGDRLTLDFSRVNIAEFELKRQQFHSDLQSEFFASYRIQDVETYSVNRSDNVGTIARNRYSTPIWLLRQYNPELDFSRIQIGQDIVFPLLEPVE
ncbi:MAG: LysM domain-containing protein, partial [Gammaproteobacteria bacterium]